LLKTTTTSPLRKSVPSSSENAMVAWWIPTIPPIFNHHYHPSQYINDNRFFDFDTFELKEPKSTDALLIHYQACVIEAASASRSNTNASGTLPSSSNKNNGFVLSQAVVDKNFLRQENHEKLQDQGQKILSKFSDERKGVVDFH